MYTNLFFWGDGLLCLFLRGVTAGDLHHRLRQPRPQSFMVFFPEKKGDGVSASKNWKTVSPPVPPKWNEYIPKKIDTQKVYGG